MKVLVTGCRDWNESHVDIIYEVLAKLPTGTIVVHGACRGVDTIAGLIAKEVLGFEVREYPARWIELGLAAGPVRNKQMLLAEHRDNEPIDLVLVFHHDLAESTGTIGMKKLAESWNIPTQYVLGPRP